MIADHLSIPVLESRTRFLNSELFKKLQRLPQLSWKLRPLYRYFVRRHARCVLMWQALCILANRSVPVNCSLPDYTLIILYSYRVLIHKTLIQSNQKIEGVHTSHHTCYPLPISSHSIYYNKQAAIAGGCWVQQLHTTTSY